MIILALVHTAVLRSADDVTPDTKQAIQPMQIYSKSRNPSDPHVFKRICTYMQISNHKHTIYRWKATKTSFPTSYILLDIIFDSLKVISEKPQVNQVVPYNPSLLDEVTPSKTRQKLDKVAKPV